MTEGRKHPAWLGEGIVLAGQWHNLPRFIRDSGGSREFIEAHRGTFTEEVIVRLKDRGVNLIIGPFYFGFGVVAERESMEDAVRLSALCHKHDIRFGAYVQTTGSLMFETFFLEVPEAKDWVSRDQDGNIPRYGPADWRYIPCLNCEPYWQYIEEKVLRYALEEVKPDLIHFDNFRWWGEPEACRCPRCTRLFRKFLETRWPDEESRFTLFGIKCFSLVEPPRYHFTDPPWKMDVLRDPMMRAWSDFKCRRLGEIYKRLAGFIAGYGAEIAVECNITPPPASNTSVNRGAWAPWVYPHGDVFWTEEKEEPGISKDGVLASRIRAFKTGRATGNAVFSYTFKGADPRLTMCESMVFNRNCLGMVGWLPDAAADPRVQSTISFYRENQGLFRGVESAAQVAVLNSYATLCYSCTDPHLELVLAEQCLIQGRIPYDTIFDEGLGSLQGYKALVLPDVECLSEEQAEAVRAFVAAGGGVVMTGRTSEFDAHRKGRLSGAALSDLFGGDVAQAGEPVGAEYGKGRAVFLPGLEPSAAPDPNFEPTVWTRARSYDHRLWALPRNATDFVEAVRWAAKSLALRVAAPDTVVAELMRQRSAARVILHVLQYETGAKPVPVRCSLAAAVPLKVHELELLSPDHAPVKIPLVKATRGVRLTIPALKVYTAVAIPLE